MSDFYQENQTRDQYNAESIHVSGISFEQYKADLEAKEKEYRELLVAHTLSQHESQRLRTELTEVERRLADTEASYNAYIKDLEERIARLDQLKGQIPDQLIEQAKAALGEGDTAKADQLFA
ncbi:MAG: hypothetical protein P8104_03300, partial [Gammaproteobacteria bacterium]